MKFRTREVAELYEQVRPVCHPEFPFLHPSYSTGACAPAVDLTNFVATWWQEEKWEPIQELWLFLVHRSIPHEDLLQRCLRAKLPREIHVSPAAVAELQAIHLLSTRAALCSGSQHMSGIASDLAATTLACRELAVDESAAHKLQAMIAREIRADSILLRGLDRSEAAVRALEVASGPLGALAPAAERLKAIPPMPRLVVEDYVHRSWGGPKLNLSLYYDHRMYGCDRQWTESYIEWLGCFISPDDDAELPASMTKDLLRKELERRQVTLPKSAKRDAIIASARAQPGLIQGLFTQRFSFCNSNRATTRFIVLLARDSRGAMDRSPTHRPSFQNNADFSTRFERDGGKAAISSTRVANSRSQLSASTRRALLIPRSEIREQNLFGELRRFSFPSRGSGFCFSLARISLPMHARLLTLLLAFSGSAVFAADTYKSPYKVEFTFKEAELIGDQAKMDWKDEASVPYREWYAESTKKRWGYWGPAAKHFDAPPGAASKGAEWMRERVIATALRFAGYGYQHHHVPDWDPPADWPKNAKQTTPVGKGFDCSNFTTFVYNLALGIRPTSDVQDQGAMTAAEGPGANRTTPAQRIELPERYEDYEKTLRTGDLLFIKSRQGNVSHVVLWVGKIGKSPEGVPLVLDSTGTGATDSNGVKIPDGVQLRPFKRSSWYAGSASHALRLIPDGK